ncbi:MAG: thiamine-phosphate kinase [Bacteroidota bacterium]
MSKSSEDIRLRLLKEILKPSISESILGVESMDDAALVRISDEESLVIASDFIRGSGFYLFTLGYLSYYDVGYYLVSANLSDIAAMGARPTGLTTVIRYTKSMSDDQYLEIFKGMQEACTRYCVSIVGGDTGGYAEDVFCATAFGIMKSKNALLRKNVKEGDSLCVTGGYLGLPISAIIYFKELKPLGKFILSEEEEKILLQSWKEPNVRIEEGVLIAEKSLANACQDISDGLKATIEQMSEISDKYFDLDESSIPIHPVTKKIAEFLGLDPVHIAVSASVDFELMFTVSKDNLSKLNTEFSEKELSFHVIGRANGDSQNWLIKNNEKTELPGIAWKHQMNDFIKDLIAN